MAVRPPDVLYGSHEHTSTRDQDGGSWSSRGMAWSHSTRSHGAKHLTCKSSRSIRRWKRSSSTAFRPALMMRGYHDDDVNRACERIEHAVSVQECLGLEAVVASIYWQCWSEVACTWTEQALRHVPQHWRSAGQRTSNRGKSPRNAITPPQAMLNYSYRLLETEAIIALRKVGLDPGMGIFHTDKPNRASMALDCMEVVRPMVDVYVLDLVESRTFGKGDVMELQDGTCRLLPPVSHLLSQQLPRWRAEIAPVVEHVANLLRPADAVGQKIRAA